MLRDQDEFGQNEYGYDFSRGYTSLDGEEARARRKPGFLARRRARKQALRAERERQRREEHDKAVEATLRKIAESGIASLTPRERRILEEETERQRAMSEGSPRPV